MHCSVENAVVSCVNHRESVELARVKKGRKKEEENCPFCEYLV